MQFVRYRHAEQTGYAILEGDTVTPLTGDPFTLPARGPRSLPAAEVSRLAPVLPSKIVGVSDNFADRARETGQAPPVVPALFLKPPSSLIGPGAAIGLPPQSRQVEYGAALAVVIGRPARWVTPAEALGCILGYTCANDLTARDLAAADGSLTRAKSFDTFCPLGPVITTTLDPTDVLIMCRVNGQARQMTSTHDMLFSIPQLIAYISSVMTLLPGDVLLTGTPAGAGGLAAGDEVEVEIEGVGLLRNSVTAAPPAGR